MINYLLRLIQITYVLTSISLHILRKAKCVYENRNTLKVQESVICVGSDITSEDRIKTSASV